MRSKWLNALVFMALVLGMVPLGSAQTPAVTARGGAHRSQTQTLPLSSPQPSLTPQEEVPADIQALFAEGMTAEEFVAMAGYVPRALEGLVEDEALMIVELEDKPLAVHYAEQEDRGRILSDNAIESYIQNLETAQAQVEARLSSLGVEILSNYTVVYNGIQVLMPLSRLNEVRALPGVKAVHRAPVHEPALGGSVPLIGATDVWEDLGYDGDGITIAIIDTGIDYTHAVFGGPGTTMAYDLNDPTMIEPNTFPTDKVIGGWDFAGTLYHAGCAPEDEADGICTRIPNPDPDPLDEHGHGTHVASIAAGFGAGDVMTGTAPGATLMALKVFGQAGSTALTLNALEWATLQYIYTGKPEVINMSLGSNFGTGELTDPSVMGSHNAAGVGIVVVASAGNAGDNAYITGSPGSADRAISVAASTTGFATGPTINVVATPYITQTDIIYIPSNFDAGGEFTEEVTAPLGYVGNLPGALNNELCTTAGIAPDALEGQVALIQRGTCAFTVKVNNAAALGAEAAIIFNNVGGTITMGGTAVDIPAGSIQLQHGLNLIPADGETIVVSAEDDVMTVPDPFIPPDSIATFSSRGPRGVDSYLKPEITAPGVGIFAADMGSGTAGVSMGGTSMAAPHVAGVAALMAQANPDWTPEEVKAAMMNTAVDLTDSTPIPISGAGRVNAFRSVDTALFAIGDEDLVSLSYGVGFTRNDSWTSAKQVTVYNEDVTPVTYDVAAAFQTGSWTTGITLNVDPVQVVVPAQDSATVTLTLAVDMTQIPIVYGPGGLEEVYGFLTLIPEGGDLTEALRLPFYFQPRPYAQLEEIEADTTILDPNTDVATITMTHTGPISSSLWIYPALLWNEMPDPEMAGPADIRLFGMDYAGSHPSYGDLVAVGINTWDYWHVPQPLFAEFNLYIDADQDGEWDYVNFNWNNGARTGGPNNNVWVVVQVDLETGMLFLGSPFVIYTDYNASYMEWYLPAIWQDLGPTNSAFDYQILGFDNGGTSTNPPARFDYARTPFAWTISHDPGPADEEALGEVAIDDLQGYLYSQPAGVMIVDYHGDPRNNNGGQAYFVPIEVSSAFLQVAHLAPFAEDASVTVRLNGADALTEFEYGDSTPYIPLPPDEYLVEIIPTGTTTVAISATLEVEALGFYTAIATGDGVNQELALIALEDDLTPPAPGTFHLRLGHLAPFAAGAATADIRLQDGTPVLTDVNYSDITGYIPLDAGEYDLVITTPGGGTTLIDPEPVTFAAGEIVSAFAAGDGINQELGVFGLPAGEPGDFLPLTTFILYMPLIARNYTPPPPPPPPEDAHLQVAHLAPFAEDASVTVSLNGTPALTDFEYGDSTGYLPLQPGTYLVEILPTGTTTVAISATLELEEAIYYTALATGDGVNQELALIALEDDLTPPDPGFFHLRLGHLAPFAAGAATADIRLQDGSPVLTDVNYSDITGYLPLPEGEYDLIITTPGGDTTLIDPLPVDFAAGDIVSAFATGEGANQDLGVFALPAGDPGFFLPLATYLQVAHLAPFAEDASVTIALNGAPALTDVGYGDSTAYLPLEAGDYLVEIIPTGTTAVAISATLPLEQATYYTALATGDGVNQELALIALEDDLTPPDPGFFHLRLGHVAPFTSSLATADIRLQDNTPVITNVNYSDVTGYIALSAGEYDLIITTPGGGTILIDPEPVTFAAGEIVSAFATGDGANQELGVFALPADEVGFFLPLNVLR